MRTNIKILFVTVISLISSSIHAQSALSIAGGYNHLRLKDHIPNENDVTDYIPYRSYTASFSYNEYITDKIFIGLELENVDIKCNRVINLRRNVTKVEGKFTSYDDWYNYSNVMMNLNYANLHVVFGRRIIAVKRLECFAVISPYAGYLIRSGTKGSGNYYSSLISVDTSGHVITMFSNGKSFGIDEVQIGMNGQKDVGACLSLDIRIRLTGKLTVFFKPSYRLGAVNVLENEMEYTRVKGYSETAGLIYKFGKGIFRKREKKTDSDTQ